MLKDFQKPVHRSELLVLRPHIWVTKMHFYLLKLHHRTVNGVCVKHSGLSQNKLCVFMHECPPVQQCDSLVCI